ncbi:glycosyltransferase family 2 protein [Devosia albogilva]|uniref:Glycosyltransferase family 2 protein n=1 Tax=Devosia albogilva TaxID=429726 RepID=A0ABW5QM30_9HYPH
MRDNYAVSIVVPTHNRSRYAISCLQSLLSIRGDIEILFHDTSNDECELRQFVSAVTDPRLTYIHHPDRLSMTANHEAALEHAKGEYVCLIGDDDSVLESVLDAVELARRNNSDVVVPVMSANYSWPDFRTQFYGAAHGGKLYLDRYSGRSYSVDAAIALERGLEGAFQGTDGLPKLYHGLVRRVVLDRIRKKLGRVFFGTSPDMSASVSVCTEIERFLVWDYPVTIPGASGGSNTGRSALNRHRGDFKTDPHMAPFQDVEWDEIVPKFFSVETVWANAAMETLRRAKPDSLAHFNLNRLYALCIIRHRDYRTHVFTAMKRAMMRPELSVSGSRIGREVARALGSNGLAKAKRLIRPTPSGGKTVVGTFENVHLAQVAMTELLSRPTS